MKRVPRGYPAGHPQAGLLKHRSLIAARDLESDAVRDVGPVYRACERLRPLLEWLAGHAAAASPGPGPEPNKRGGTVWPRRTGTASRVKQEGV